jgi:hypothetical protein
MPEFLVPELKPLIGVAMLLATMTLAACAATTSTSQPMPVVRTPEQIKGDCWMKYEGDAKMNIDKRAALVDACVAERSKTQAPIN